MKSKTLLTTNLLKMFLSIIIILLPIFSINNLKIIFIVFFTLYGIINIVQYIVNKDKESLYMILNNVITVLLCIILDIEGRQRYLAFMISVWAVITALVKLKTIEKNKSNKDNDWKLESISLGIYSLSGLIAMASLGNPPETQLIVIGFFLFINNILDLMTTMIETKTEVR